MKRYLSGLLRHQLRRSHRSSISKLSYVTVKEGDVIHNYCVIRVEPISKLFLTAVQLKHIRTNSNHLHLARDDNNNVFNVLLRTTPMDNTGVAHILEHIVLTGSNKYPVRDPFFKMLDRSMANFMNAMTGSDYTMYPFATQNAKDFKNLMSVYLDAVFFPKIEKSSFLQEGWRMEHSDCEDEKTPIKFKGVVFNEMKGVMADPDYLFGTNLQQKLLPDHTYGFCSGGDPLSIPDLTWDSLKKFHSTHYHPSNANFFTYGNFDLQDHLKQIDEQVMQKFSPISPDTSVPSQMRWCEPRSARITCLPDEMAAMPEKQTSVAVGFLLTDVADSYESFVASFLCSLLSDGPTSPFYKSLIESGLGSSYSPATGFHGHQKECLFSVGLQGIHKDHEEKVKSIIHETIGTVIEEGFDTEQIEGLLHQVELQLKHQKSNFGLHLSFNLMPSWQHGADPMTLLDVDAHIAKLRNDLENDPEFLQKLCVKYFKENKHFLTLTMSADPTHSAKLEEKEEELRKEKLSRLEQSDLSNLFSQGQDLMLLQSREEDISCLPTLTVGDIPRQQLLLSPCQTYALSENAKVALHDQPTNGVTYFSLVRTINNIPEHLKPYLPVFCSVLTQMGSQDIDYQKFSRMENMHTGGLHASVSVSPSPERLHVNESKVTLTSHCLDKNIHKMFDLWVELIKKPYFNNKDRLQTLIRQSAQNVANSVAFSGHHYAMSSASEGLSPSSSQSEVWEGLKQVSMLQSLAAESDIDHVIGKMEAIAQYVLSEGVPNGESARLSMHFADNTENVQSEVTNFHSTIAKSEKTCWTQSSCQLSNFHCCDGFEIQSSRKVLHQLPLPVNFASMCLPVPVTYCHEHAAALRILSRILTTKYLLREVREKGGAYGAGASFAFDGIFKFFSYRDPRSLDTIQTFRDSIYWACDGGFLPEHLDEAKLAVFQKVDAPVAPCNRGKSYFHEGITDQMRQAHRERLLDATREDVISVAQQYLTLPNPNCVIIGAKNEAIEKESDWSVSEPN